MLRYIAIIATVMMMSCNERSKDKAETVAKSHIGKEEQYYRLLDTAIWKGDTACYDGSYSYFVITERSWNFLYYAILMANKYGYNKAFFDVYYILSNPKNGGEGIHNLDAQTRKLALCYLLRAYHLDYKEAIREVNDIRKSESSGSLDSVIASNCCVL